MTGKVAPPEKLPATPEAGTILFRWALTSEERISLSAAGWREAARHPIYQGSALMRFEG